MNNQKEHNQKQPITKQQLFVNPITLIQKSIGNHQIQNSPAQLVQLNQFTNIGQMIIDTVQSNVTNQTKTKTKLITKIQPIKKFKNYRTSICPYGIECRKRLTCNYAHNQNQLRKPYRNRKNPCVRYQKGLCGLGAACPDYHGNMDLKKKNYRYKVLPCKQWDQKGYCPKGDLCIYIHGEENSNLSEDIIDEESMNNSIERENDNKEKIIQTSSIQKQEQKQQKQIPTNQNIQKDKKLIIGQIFKSTIKKTIIAKETIEQPLKQSNQQNQQVVEDDNFNIEFNF